MRSENTMYTLKLTFDQPYGILAAIWWKNQSKSLSDNEMRAKNVECTQLCDAIMENCLKKLPRLK